MKVCFVDEAGDLGALANPPLSNDQPVLVVCGIFVDTAIVQNFTNDFLNLKQRYFPGLNYPSTNHLDRILPEIKGPISERTQREEPRASNGTPLDFSIGLWGYCSNTT